MRDHFKLKAFSLADELVIEIYRITMIFPKHEMYGITSQIRRAAISVSSKIVEGCARESQSEYHRFLEMAYASLRESHYLFDLAIRLKYIELDQFDSIKNKFLVTEKVLGSLVRKMRN